MASLKIGAKGPDFNLPGVDGKTYSLDSFRDKKAVVVIISCNHCPVVIDYEDRMVRIQADYAGKGVALVAINPNNEVTHPDDSFDKMVKRARDKKFNFPYLRDESQAVARAYGAERTPEIFVLGPDRTLVYHGRIDDNAKTPSAVTSPDLRRALDELLAGKPVSVPDTPPVGCTVKWK
jgi:peroxiredoxin